MCSQWKFEIFEITANIMIGQVMHFYHSNLLQQTDSIVFLSHEPNSEN